MIIGLKQHKKRAHNDANRADMQSALELVEPLVLMGMLYMMINLIFPLLAYMLLVVFATPFLIMLLLFGFLSGRVIFRLCSYD